MKRLYSDKNTTQNQKCKIKLKNKFFLRIVMAEFDEDEKYPSKKNLITTIRKFINIIQPQIIGIN